MADKKRSPAKLESREDLRLTETQQEKEGLAPANPRRPISASTHLETNPYDQREQLRLLTLLFDDGGVWRQYVDAATERIRWRQVYELGDEEPKPDV